MAHLLLFGPARQAAGTGRAVVDGATLAAVRDAACVRFGPEFAAVVRSAALWLNGEAVADDAAVGADDEVAVIPPVSGGER